LRREDGPDLAFGDATFAHSDPRVPRVGDPHRSVVDLTRDHHIQWDRHDRFVVNSDPDIMTAGTQ
jgi:hypothetical protein